NGLKFAAGLVVNQLAAQPRGVYVQDVRFSIYGIREGTVDICNISRFIAAIGRSGIVYREAIYCGLYTAVHPTCPGITKVVLLAIIRQAAHLPAYLSAALKLPVNACRAFYIRWLYPGTAIDQVDRKTY